MSNTNQKTAEEILDKHVELDDYHDPFHRSLIAAMEEYADQATANLRREVEELKERVKEVEGFRNDWFKATGEANNRHWKTMEQLTESQQLNEKLMGLLEKAIKKANNHARYGFMPKPDPEQAWQSFRKEHGLNS